MNIIIWLGVGGLIGWLVSIDRRTNGQQGTLANVGVGITGAMLSGWFWSPLLGVAPLDQSFSLRGLLMALLGAVTLLAIVNVGWRGALR
jgi:uncharacterized membrane protein YeaQ/YmgE (transglycosylase-associated protein family)